MRCLYLTLMISTALMAQSVPEQGDPERGVPEQAWQDEEQDFVSSASPMAGDPYAALTMGQNYSWTLHRIFDPARLFVTGAGAALDHTKNNPSDWGQGPEGYSIRVASRLGAVAVKQNLAFAIRAFDREDPRYFRSGSGSVWKRTRYAVSRGFVARKSDGGAMPAYSTFVSSVATPFIAQTWRPERFDAGRDLRTGGVGLGLNAIGSLGQEFWPDVRRKLRH